VNWKFFLIVAARMSNPAATNAFTTGTRFLEAGQVQRCVAGTILRVNVGYSTLALAKDTSSCAIAIVGAQERDGNGHMSLGTV
jgi:hypothetical protein